MGEKTVEKKAKVPALRSHGTELSSTDFQNILNSSFDDVYRLLEVQDTDNATQLLYRRMIQASYRMLCKIEASTNAESNTRGAYAFNAVASTLKDYINNLQMSLDKGRLAENIIDNILRPLFLEMASTLVVQFGIVTKEAKLAIKDEHQAEDFTKTVLRVAQDKIIDAMQRAYEKAKLDARKALS